MARRNLVRAGLGLVGALSLGTPSARAAAVTVDANRVVRIDGQPFFPIMQWLQCRSRIKDQAALGINTFVGNGCDGDSSLQYLDECKAQNVWAVLDPDDMSVKSHTSLLGWIFGDEPDLEGNEVEPSALLTRYQSIKATDPNHVTFLTLTAGFYSEIDVPTWMGSSRARYSEYPKGTDLVGFDLYPVYGWCQPGWMYRVGASQSELSTYAAGKATYQWIEASDESSQWCENCDRCASAPSNCDKDHTCTGDGVTAAEVRNEIWQAIAHGATAIGYFTHAWECPDYTQFCVGSKLQTEMKRTNAQVTALAPLLLEGTLDATAKAVVTPSGRFDVLSRAAAGRLLIVAVNVERTSVRATLTVGGIEPDTSIEVYEENRALHAEGQSFTDTFDPLSVHLYWASAPGGHRDAGPAGAGGQNAGPAGAGGQDAGLAGAGGQNAVPASAGGQDAGPASAGGQNAGPASAGGRDAVSTGAGGRQGSAPDAATGSNGAAGQESSPPRGEGGGCGCRMPREDRQLGTTASLSWVALALSAMRRRHQRRRASSLPTKPSVRAPPAQVVPPFAPMVARDVLPSRRVARSIVRQALALTGCEAIPAVVEARRDIYISSP